jgi:hypothetical protein
LSAREVIGEVFAPWRGRSQDGSIVLVLIRIVIFKFETEDEQDEAENFLNETPVSFACLRNTAKFLFAAGEWC